MLPSSDPDSFCRFPYERISCASTYLQSYSIPLWSHYKWHRVFSRGLVVLTSFLCPLRTKEFCIIKQVGIVNHLPAVCFSDYSHNLVKNSTRAFCCSPVYLWRSSLDRSLYIAFACMPWNSNYSPIIVNRARDWVHTVQVLYSLSEIDRSRSAEKILDPVPKSILEPSVNI